MGKTEHEKYFEMLGKAMGKDPPTHFKCWLHGVILPLSEYDTHCEKEHGGGQIAVEYLTQPKEA